MSGGGGGGGGGDSVDQTVQSEIEISSTIFTLLCSICVGKLPFFLQCHI